MQRDMHPTLLSSLEGIVDQMVWFRENWHEEVRYFDTIVKKTGLVSFFFFFNLPHVIRADKLD